MTRQRDIIARRLLQLQRLRGYLEYSTQRMRQEGVANLPPRQLGFGQAEILAAFRTRFAEYQEQLGKLLKAIAVEEGVTIVGMTDVLAFAEKADILGSMEDWKEPRDVRNAIAHDYEENEDLLADLIRRMLELVETLQRIHERAEQYCRARYAVPPAPTF